MTKTYALKRLLEHGPLTVGEVIEITGWPYCSGRKVLYRLVELGLVDKKNGKWGLV